MLSPHSLHALDPASIVTTADRLAARVGERFPEAGLSRVALAVRDTARVTQARVSSLARPHWPLRLLAALCVSALLALVLYGLRQLLALDGFDRISEVLQATESLVNELILLGLTAVFLFSLEGRLKRRRALGRLHELRSLAHIIDMHQLTKDPEQLFSPLPDTGSSPGRIQDPAQLARYLDYCSELLSLVSKLAALYGQSVSDGIVFGAVNDIESLVGGLQRKVWQKIGLLERAAAQGRRPAAHRGRTAAHAPSAPGVAAAPHSPASPGVPPPAPAAS